MNRMLLRSLVVFGLALPAAPAFCGWSSGGGELLKDSINPWFVANTKVVRYCIEEDEANFGVSKARAGAVIRQAIGMWQKEFAALDNNVDAEHVIGTQTFVEEECTHDTDLVFQLGVLDAMQKEYLHDPSQVVGVAVRTAYDTVNLRAKGFIYIAPEHGELRLTGDQVQSGYWSGKQHRLTLVLLHELGHVFGLPHSIDIMATGFTEAMVGPLGLLYEPLSLPERVGFLKTNLQSEETSSPYHALTSEAAFFGFPPTWHDMKIAYTPTGFTVYARDTRQQDEQSWQLVGTAELQTRLTSMGDPWITLYLGHDQAVFPRDKDVVDYLMAGVTKQTLVGVYHSVDGRRTWPTAMDQDPSNTRISGVIDGQLIPDVLNLGISSTEHAVAEETAAAPKITRATTPAWRALLRATAQAHR